jgi:CBS domain-containing protein
MLVKSVMSERVIHVSPDTELKEIAASMRDGDLGSIPVSDHDRLVGMVTDRDIVVRGLAGTMEFHSLTARDVMSPAIKYCYEDEDIEHVLDNMAELQVRRLPVVSRDKRLVGIVSLGDLSKQSSSRKAGEALEEISKSDLPPQPRE